MMAMSARLHHLRLGSPQPERLARFYQDTLGMEAARDGDHWLCRGPERCLVIGPGEAGALHAAAYQLDDADMLDGLRARLDRHGIGRLPCSAGLLTGDAVAFRDPDGNEIVFGVGQAAPSSPTADMAARLQHVVVGSLDPARMVAFYSEVVGFRISDRVLDANRGLRTCFLRSDHEHHSFAVFQTDRRRLDHHCYELPDWNAIRDWGDHLASRGIVNYDFSGNEWSWGRESHRQGKWKST